MFLLLELLEKACDDVRQETTIQHRQQLLEKDRSYAEQLRVKDIQIQGKEEEIRRMTNRYSQLEKELSEARQRVVEVETKSHSSSDQIR